MDLSENRPSVPGHKVLFQGSPEKEPQNCKLQNATDLHCLLKSPKEKEQVSCCKKGWVLNGFRCYYFSQDRTNWNNSRQNCIEMGSDLVVINSEAEQDFLTSHLEALTSQDANFFIGLTDQEGTDQWQWVDKTPFNDNATFWSQGGPSRKGEYCVAIHIQKGRQTDPKRNWNDRRCTTRCNHICETLPIILFIKGTF
ncbi:C-type lectin domain family 4 member A-like isoform X2 [Tiliqua scincoides]|uniref:C-type lectin domain family 4 member A-like isoform X2 n=1 Tax=Tiliqua scincoides TaxID=71010 RepID=UPI0034635542